METKAPARESSGLVAPREVSSGKPGSTGFRACVATWLSHDLIAPAFRRACACIHGARPKVGATRTKAELSRTLFSRYAIQPPAAASTKPANATVRAGALFCAWLQPAHVQ